MFPGKTVYKWGNVIDDPQYLNRTDAIDALTAYGSIVALDALMGTMDRVNAGNHIYVEDQKKWYGVDYSFSFNIQGTAGVGNPADPFTQTYYPQLIEAIKTDCSALKAGLTNLQKLTDNDIDRLLALPPDAFASATDRGAMANFLKDRRPRILRLLQEWCVIVGLGGIL